RRRELHAVQRQVAHLGLERLLLRPPRVDLDGALLRDARQHALPRVLEPVALRGKERARAARAFVLALDYAIEPMRGAAEDAAHRAEEFARVALRLEVVADGHLCSRHEQAATLSDRRIHGPAVRPQSGVPRTA